MSSPAGFEGVRRSETVRVWLLGGFRVSVGSRVITHDAWRLRKAAALVKLLALAPGHRMHREQMMDLLWPDSGRKAASNSLRKTLHAARRVLDPDAGSRYLASEDESLVLCPGDNLWIDVETFEEAVATARRSRDPAAYRAALELYAGELLPEDRYEDWVEGRREGLRNTWLSLHVELSRVYERGGEYERGIATLRRAVTEEPTLEEAHADLMRLYALGGRRAEGIAQFERLKEALSTHLGAEPGAEATRLRGELLAGTFPPARAQPGAHSSEQPPGEARHNLPAPRDSFVGREREMVEVMRALAMTRLLTLTGAGGSGKTRLALEVARDLVGAYPDGVWLVEIAPLSEASLVAQEVANALGVHERPGEPPIGTLEEALANKQMLVILDNCEHLIEEAARLMDVLLTSCPRLKVLATSREHLGILGEVTLLVPPLSLPNATNSESARASATKDIMRYEAVRLFVNRAQLRLPDFELTQENASAVARVCRKLDGIPLAIELATARMGSLAVEQVAQRLDASLDVLKGSSRSAATRQQTLSATLDWSYDLLSRHEQTFFRRLSVFAGGWTLEAVEVVCSGDGIEKDDVLDLLGWLVDKSLVVARTSTDDAVRYRMLEPISQYAAQKLEESGQAEEVRVRHAAFFLYLAEEAEPELAGQRQGTWVERLEAEHDNMRRVLSGILEREEAGSALRLVAALWRFWHLRGHLSEGVGWLERALAQSDPAASPARVKALEGVGWLAQSQGDYDRARASYEEMLELSRMLGDKGNIASALNSLGTVAAYKGESERARALLQENLSVLEELEEGNPTTLHKRYHALNLLGALAIYADGDYARGEALWEESLALIRKAGDTDQIGLTLSNLAYPILLQGEFERARRLCEEALSVARELGSVGFIPTASVNLGLAQLGLGQHERAAGSFREAVHSSWDVGANLQTIEALEGMASLAGATEDAPRAARLWGAAEAAREAGGIALPPGERALHEPYLAAARSWLGEATWEEVLADGRTMSLVEATRYVVSEAAEQPTTAIVQDPSAHFEPMNSLTPREREVALLVAQGLTNRQISTKLGISERTAANHVARILKKLGLSSRIRIASWVAERQLHAPDQN